MRVLPSAALRAFRPVVGMAPITGDPDTVVSVTGAVLCWGNNIFRQLGLGAPGGIHDTPTGVAGFGTGHE